jgi:radical SAM protein with 4Fe4S-binding SPASM domain
MNDTVKFLGEQIGLFPLYRQARLSFLRETGPRVLPPLPVKLRLQLTNVCNARCVFCAYRKLKPEPRFLSDKHFDQAVQQYATLGGRTFLLNCTVGDPLLDPKLADRILAIKAVPGATVDLITNLLALHRHDMADILKLDHIDVSTTALDRDIYRRVYGVDGYAQFSKNLYSLLEAARPGQVLLHFRMDVPPWTFKRLPDVRELRRRYPELSMSFLYGFTSWNGIVQKADLTGTMRLREGRPRRVPCANLYTAAIQTDGRVEACACQLSKDGSEDLTIGHLDHASLQEIWGNARHQEILAQFRAGRYPQTCANCVCYSPQ